MSAQAVTNDSATAAVLCRDLVTAIGIARESRSGDSTALDRICALLDRGADPNCALDRFLLTPVMEAARTDQLAVLEILLSRGGDVRARDGLGRTALQIAFLRAPSEPVVRRLLDAGSDARAVDSAGNTVLHFARFDRWLESTRLVIDAGADIDAENIVGDTPLCGALDVDRNGGPMVELFLRAGARPCSFDMTGNPAVLLTPQTDSTSWTGIRLPCDLDDAIVSLDAMLHRRFKASLGIAPELQLVDLHMGLGRWLRNNWGLWADAPLACWFESVGVVHPDHMSSIIFSVYRRRLRGEPSHIADLVQEAMANEAAMKEHPDR